MPTQFSSQQAQEILSTPTGYRRYFRFTFSRGGVTEVLEPISGSVTQDTRRGGRWDGRLSFTGDDVIPVRPGDLLTPFGTRVQAEVGLELLTGETYTVPYGTFDIATARTRTEAGVRVVDVGLVDISDRIERYRMEAPIWFPAATDLSSVINTVITNRTGFNPGVGSQGQTLGAVRFFGLEPSTAPWSELLDILKSYKRTAWYDRVGDLQVGSTTWDASSAYPIDDLITSLSADFDTRPANVFVVRGEAQDGSAPAYVTAIDTDPSSPTYAGTGPGTSPYGRVTHFYSSTMVNRYPGGATLVAKALLAARVGAGASYTLTKPYDPTITAGDVVSLDGQALAVDAVTLDVSGDTSCQVREL